MPWNLAGQFSFSHAGFCPGCEKNAVFTATDPYFRDFLKCDQCGSIPRHRVVMHVLSQFRPDWRELAIHEGSPGWDIVSRRLAGECASYTASQYDVSVPPGTVVEVPGMPCRSYRAENLESQTFPDESFDVVITQDVFEHVFHPDKAIREIARTLRPGGITVMTTPIIRGIGETSRRRAEIVDGRIHHLLAPEYHDSPIGEGGSLVTVEWGYDIVCFLQRHSGLNFMLLKIDNIDLGLRADYNEVLIGVKSPPLRL
ncbi:class I SAM-dependent methyltransferase [Rhodovastum atsumiense]|nr:class I SAM-dependent methyltransferase [Rhodovastum atsumiense]